VAFSADGSCEVLDGLGLTCATFVLAVFASRGIPLVRLDEWQARSEDVIWQDKIISDLRSWRKGDPEVEAHAAALQGERGCVRYRPEEVMAAGIASELPIGYEFGEEMGRRIAAKLISRR
jgi:hypothetical protein